MEDLEQRASMMERREVEMERREVEMERREVEMDRREKAAKRAELEMGERVGQEGEVEVQRASKESRADVIAHIASLEIDLATHQRELDQLSKLIKIEELKYEQMIKTRADEDAAWFKIRADEDAAWFKTRADEDAGWLLKVAEQERITREREEEKRRRSAKADTQRKEIEHLSAQVAQVDAQVAQREAQAAQLATDNSQLAAELDRLKTECADETNQLRILEDQCSQTAAEIKSLKETKLLMDQNKILTSQLNDARSTRSSSIPRFTKTTFDNAPASSSTVSRTLNKAGQSSAATSSLVDGGASTSTSFGGAHSTSNRRKASSRAGSSLMSPVDPNAPLAGVPRKFP